VIVLFPELIAGHIYAYREKRRPQSPILKVTLVNRFRAAAT
jgi:hypothetical protein